MNTSSLPKNLKYSRTHEWLKMDANTSFAKMGITNHAQSLLGDIVFVELPPVGKVVSAGEECGVVESVKAASDIYAPISGTVVAVNTALNATPEIINQDPYEAGWILQIQASDIHEAEQLLSPDHYELEIAQDH